MMLTEDTNCERVIISQSLVDRLSLEYDRSINLTSWSISIYENLTQRLMACFDYQVAPKHNMYLLRRKVSLNPDSLDSSLLINRFMRL